MDYLTNPSTVSFVMSIQGMPSKMCFVYVAKEKTWIQRVIVSASIFCNYRYKNPVDIPLGNAKQKIKSLKARVCRLW